MASPLFNSTPVGGTAPNVANPTGSFISQTGNAISNFTSGQQQNTPLSGNADPATGGVHTPLVTPPNVDPSGNNTGVTGASGNKNNSPIISTTAVSNQYDDLSNQLQQLQEGSANYASAFQQQYQGLLQNNALAEQQAISSATAKQANAENINNAQEASTLYGIRAAAAANGQSRYAPAQTALQTGAAQNSFQFKYNQLDQQESLAIASAKAAKSSGDVKALGDMVNFIKGVQDQKLELYKTAIQQSQYENTFNNLSANQQATLGLGEQKLSLQQFIANNPAGTQTSASFLTPFKGQTTTKNAVQSVNVGGQFYTAGTLGGKQYYQSGDNWYPVPQQ